MKKICYLFFLPIVCLFVISCKKNSGSTPGGNNGSGQLVRIQQGFGVDDTVYVLKYNAQNNLVSVIDSINEDTLVAAYNPSGQLSGITEFYGAEGDQIGLTYNASGQLTEADYTIAGESDQYIYEYSGGSLSKKTWNSNFGSGPLQLWRYDMITVSGGNITDVKEYNSSDVLQTEHKMTYGSQPNTFKNLALFNWANRLGAYDIINGELETYFCANIVKTTTWYDGGGNIQYTATAAPVFNSSGNPTSIVATEKDPGGNTQNVFTWGFSYK